MSELRYDGQVVVVTGAGGGLGKGKLVLNTSAKLYTKAMVSICAVLWLEGSECGRQ